MLSTEKLATVFILVQQSGHISLKAKEVSRRKHLAVHRTSCITKHTGRGPYPGSVGFLFYFKGRERFCGIVKRFPNKSGFSNDSTTGKQLPQCLVESRGGTKSQGVSDARVAQQSPAWPQGAPRAPTNRDQHPTTPSAKRC